MKVICLKRGKADGCCVCVCRGRHEPRRIINNQMCTDEEGFCQRGMRLIVCRCIPVSLDRKRRAARKRAK